MLTNSDHKRMTRNPNMKLKKVIKSQGKRKKEEERNKKNYNPPPPKKPTNTWRLNNMLLNYQWITEEIKEEIKKYLETSENENTMIQNL